MATNRRVAALLVAGSVALAAGAVARAQEAPPPQGKSTLVYIGTHTTDGKAKGLYLFRLQSAGTEVFQNVTLVPLGVAAETQNPTFFHVDPKRRLLFSVNEVEQFDGKPGGSVSAFSIDETGRLAPINQVASMGARPCRFASAADGKQLVVVNCADGTIAVVPVAADGRLGNASDVVKGVKATCAAADPAGAFVFVCEASTDRVLGYALDGATGKLKPLAPAATSLKPGSAPRQIAFRPDGQFAYVLNEKSSTITIFSYDAATGAMKEIESVSTVPEYFDGPNMALDFGVHVSGKYAYASNAGHDSVVLFNVDKEKGTLTFVEEQGTGGRSPREFGLQVSPGGHMAISLPETNQVLASRIDETNGRLKPSGIFADVPSPASIRFLAPQSGAAAPPAAEP